MLPQHNFFSYLAVGISTQLWGKLVSPVEPNNRIPEPEGTIGYHHFGWFSPLDGTSVTRN